MPQLVLPAAGTQPPSAMLSHIVPPAAEPRPTLLQLNAQPPRAMLAQLVMLAALLLYAPALGAHLHS